MLVDPLYKTHLVECYQHVLFLPAALVLLNKLFYFNHGYVLNTDTQFQLATSEFTENIVAIIRKNNIWGIQFHPESIATSYLKY